MLFLNKDSQIRVCLQIQNRAFNTVLYFQYIFLGLYIYIIYIYIFIYLQLCHIFLHLWLKKLKPSLWQHTEVLSFKTIHIYIQKRPLFPHIIYIPRLQPVKSELLHSPLLWYRKWICFLLTGFALHIGEEAIVFS